MPDHIGPATDRSDFSGTHHERDIESRSVETRGTAGFGAPARYRDASSTRNGYGSETSGHVSARVHTRENVIETGTTVLAITGRDGVVLAADTRASLGGRFVTNRSTRKIEAIGDHAAVAFSGSVSDAQAFVRQLRCENRLYELRHGNRMPLETLATLAGGLVRRGPYQILELLLAGVDVERAERDETTDPEAASNELEPAVYDVGRGGGVMSADYAASGSGMQLAYGALEGTVDPSTSVEELRSVAVDAVRSATARDTASGDGMLVATITGVDREIGDGVEPAVAFETLEASDGFEALQSVDDLEADVEAGTSGRAELDNEDDEDGDDGEDRSGDGSEASGEVN